jgi:hypothetical protein
VPETPLFVSDGNEIEIPAWSVNDQTGITYYNFVGHCASGNTVGSLIATSEWYQNWIRFLYQSRVVQRAVDACVQLFSTLTALAFGENSAIGLSACERIQTPLEFGLLFRWQGLCGIHYLFNGGHLW